MSVNPWLPPDSLSEPLRDIVIAAETEALGVMRPALEEGYDEARSRIEAMVAAIGLLLTTDAIREAWRRARAEATSLSTEHWLREAARAGVISQINDPRPPVDLVDRWEQESVELYTRIQEQTGDEARGAIEVAAGMGVASAVLAADWDANGIPTVNGRMRGRGELISSDRLWTLAAIVAAAQQRDAGISAFVWTSQQDSRVRPLHRALHGRTYKWDAPPSEGYPGEPVNCRCWAVGVTVEPDDDD